MSIQRVAFIAFHTCPLVAPGEGKAGGMNVYVRQLADGLGALGIRVDIFTRKHAGNTDSIDVTNPNVRVIHLSAGRPLAIPEDLYPALPGFLNKVRSFQQQHRLTYQAIHSHYWLSGWIGRILALELELPHVITFHTLALIKMQARVGEVESHLRSKVEKDLMRTADQVVAFSPHERDAMVMLYDANAERIKLIPCGVDLSLFRPMDRRMARKKLGLNGHKVLVWVGRVEPLKGLDLLMHTTAQMTDYLEMKVLVVGGDIKSDREIGRLRRLALDLKVDKVFKFVGRVTQQNLPMYYNAADVCVIPSYYESFGLAALEAMACGTPVVATRVGGLSTVIQHGRTGYLKSWRCPEAFANSLEILMLNKSLQRSMGLAARHRAEGMGWDKVAAKITNIYNALATGVTPEMLDHTS